MSISRLGKAYTKRSFVTLNAEGNDPLDHGVLQKLLLIYSIPRACYTKISTLFTHRFCETVVF